RGKARARPSRRGRLAAGCRCRRPWGLRAARPPRRNASCPGRCRRRSARSRGPTSRGRLEVEAQPPATRTCCFATLCAGSDLDGDDLQGADLGDPYAQAHLGDLAGVSVERGLDGRELVHLSYARFGADGVVLARGRGEEAEGDGLAQDDAKGAVELGFAALFEAE